MIELNQVTRRFGEKVAVDQMSFTTTPGKLFAFIGPNGAGKTTTIKMMVGLLRADEGTVTIGGFDTVTQQQNVAEILGYVPDEPNLYEKLSGRELLEFVAQLRSIPDKEIDDRIQKQVDYFELGGFYDQLIETYSHGMRQRLAFATAVMHDPKVLIVDEPMVGLDPKSMRLVKDLLRTQAADGATVFLSTHTLAIVEELADQIGVVCHGQLRYYGTRDEIEHELRDSNLSLEEWFLRLTK
ncbi:MAG: ABC transporter ATP-binding protein [Planctomycetia bacterium]|jgi:ABC-2 type transport system ATP-binding protein